MTRQQDVNLSEIMVRERIACIKPWIGGVRFSVELDDGRFGVGKTVGEALEKAKAAHAFNVRRAA